MSKDFNFRHESCKMGYNIIGFVLFSDRDRTKNAFKVV